MQVDMLVIAVYAVKRENRCRGIGKLIILFGSHDNHTIRKGVIGMAMKKCGTSGKTSKEAEKKVTKKKATKK